MIRHVALFRLKPGSAEEAPRILGELERIGNSIPSIASFRAGPDVGENAGNFDIAACVDFENLDAYRKYRDHPEHVRFFEEVMRPHLDARSAVQFEI